MKISNSIEQIIRWIRQQVELLNVLGPSAFFRIKIAKFGLDQTRRQDCNHRLCATNICLSNVTLDCQNKQVASVLIMQLLARIRREELFFKVNTLGSLNVFGFLVLFSKPNFAMVTMGQGLTRPLRFFICK